MPRICIYSKIAIPAFLIASLFAVKPAWGAIGIDANVSKNQATASTSIQTGTFSTTAGNELLLAFIATDGVSTPNITVTNVTTTGLSWTLVRRTNVHLGTSEIWRAFSTVPLSNITVRAALVAKRAFLDDGDELYGCGHHGGEWGRGHRDDRDGKWESRTPNGFPGDHAGGLAGARGGQRLGQNRRAYPWARTSPCQPVLRSCRGHLLGAKAKQSNADGRNPGDDQRHRTVYGSLQLDDC